MLKLLEKIQALKEVTPDERIDFMEQIETLEDRLIALREALGNLPDAEPPEGKKDPRAEFVDSLMAEAGVSGGRNK